MANQPVEMSQTTSQNNVPRKPVPAYVDSSATSNFTPDPWWPSSQKSSLGNIWRSSFKFKAPSLYQKPGRIEGGARGKHVDALKRIHEGPRDDRYLSPWDGHLAKIVVQCSQDIYKANYDNRHSKDPEAPAAVTWRRTYMGSSAPHLLRVATWATEKDHNFVVKFFRWGVSVGALVFVIMSPVVIERSSRGGATYDPVHYKYWGYPRQTRNQYEDKDKFESHSGLQNSYQAPEQRSVELRGMLGQLDRLDKPEYLCFLESKRNNRVENVADWVNMHGDDTSTEYVFISWTTKHFNPLGNPDDFAFLHKVGEYAARKAGVPAYWISAGCLGSSDEEVELNIWKICDVVRSADSMVVAVSSPIPGVRSYDTVINEWSERVWTLPELLLCPGSDDIPVFHPAASFENARTYQRRNLPLALNPANQTPAKALVDHFEGSVKLGSLELITIALRCLNDRGRPDFLNGDLSYALMGLLRQRPPVNREDSSFQAFARLSLANDSDQLLERLICILPKTIYQPWHNMDDQWGAVLWDIYPTTQVCGISNDNTVIVDGAKAAVIRWKSFPKVTYTHRATFKRKLCVLALRTSSLFFFLGSILTSVGGGVNFSGNRAVYAIGALMIVWSVLLLLPAPYLINKIYGGKIWNAEAWLLGFEGYMDIESIEKMIFGMNRGALSWSAAGSPLSWHRAEDDLCVGMDPLLQPDTKARVKKAITSRMGEEKIFTLVDTYSMTVTMFSAVRPPIAAIICGEEGGMQRALMCSYDWTRQTFQRETVLRMETPVHEKMEPLRRFRLGLNAGFDLGNRVQDNVVRNVY